MSSTFIKNARIATANEHGDFVHVDATEMLLKDGKIYAMGNNLTVEAETTVDANGQWCLPGFIDCHTHLVYGGNRANEFSQRLTGVSYETISKQGGGIKNTVRATRALDEDSLLTQTLRRAKRLAEEGVTTVEIKSGYGLDKETEIRMLNVAQKVGELANLNIQRTFLGAHALPPDSELSAEEYIDFVCQTMIPYVAEHQLADAVDVFCERVGFNLAQTERVFMAAKQSNLRVKGHVEQLSDSKGAALAAKYHALSVDHIEYLAQGDVPLLAEAGTVAVLLPGAFYFLKETQLPPIETLRKYKVPMAVSTDMNPGTSPIASLLTCTNMACVLFGLTTSEALTGITAHAAKALGLTRKGIIKEGFDADVCLWDIGSPDSLVYEINGYRPTAKWIGGKRVL
ncbi:imidazolonepropionase [Alteromonas ponticola]|uniref:Imidazolonepropionase n=1 Tax=Alteromonas aquimaris TaxID=2998417 RepID=A0ABT3P703_9ALTE|nr:imidazolonepropionase [Alteromonas aquimaris]MCW8108549.1 imidazolonepropionase [Alteromonas aquimaris]